MEVFLPDEEEGGTGESRGVGCKEDLWRVCAGKRLSRKEVGLTGALEPGVEVLKLGEKLLWPGGGELVPVDRRI